MLQNKNATLSEINEIDREWRRNLVESAEKSNVLRISCRVPRKNQRFDMECHVKRLNIEESVGTREVQPKTKEFLEVTNTSYS